MLIVAGYVITDAEDRDAFVAEGVTVVSMARSAPAAWTSRSRRTRSTCSA
ncbi:hypothetical protein [Pseudonocardia charpentierae]|uniref:Uncharacterized protein n=1 Tax=Pseudonocardia charpentierae TaxID=3075545 RepID=A0ABU2NHB5_9PSEU|nr:hypothetical protein [Pseudonocardia sp. DSM 45834]MDT0352977.1 hypothetical protein [Pseudonocardia sp. DSM 45834]